MSKPKQGGPAWPSLRYTETDGCEYSTFDGMSLRDWFAGQTLIGLINIAPRATNLMGDISPQLVESSYKVADAMIAEREKGANDE